MGTITLPNFRVSGTVRANVRLKDGGVYVEWGSLTEIKAWLYSEEQKAIAGRFEVEVDPQDGTRLKCVYGAQKPQYLGVNKIIVQAKYDEQAKAYDKPLLNFVRWTAGQAGEQITMDDPEVDVEIVAEDISSSILDEATAAALAAAENANEAAGNAGDAAEAALAAKGAAENAATAAINAATLASIAIDNCEEATRQAITAASLASSAEGTAREAADEADTAKEAALEAAAAAAQASEVAGTDHTRAENDHSTATSDHNRAGTDHTAAASDHTQAGQDHTRANDDHTQAAADHTRAQEDHAVMQGYDSRLGAVEGEVTELGTKLGDLELPVKGGIQVITYIDNEYVNQNTGAFTHYTGWSRTGYLNVHGMTTLEYINPDADSIYNAFYDKNKAFISSFRTIKRSTSATVTIPSNAEWCILSNTSTAIRQLTLPNLREYTGIDAIEIKVNEIDETVHKSEDIFINTATSINDIEVYVIDLGTRVDFILPILLNARIQILTNSGYQVSYSLQKADGTTLYDSAWLSSINLQGTLYNYPTTSRIRLYFRKSDASVTSISDIKANAVSEMVVDYITKEWNVRPDLTIENSILKDIHDLAVGGNGILDLNPEKEVVPKLGNLTRRYISYGGSATEHPPVLSFIHMSDAHADNENILRVKSFYDKYSEYLNGGVIDTGDFIGQNLAQGLPTSTPEVPDFIRILGNHDAYYYVDGSWQLAPQLDCYNVCFKDYIGEWGVVQPENAAINGYCYFYKDFSENGVMMVALDYDHWDATQNTWLVNTLAVALTNGRHVIILVHRAPFRITADTSNPFQNIDYINRTFADHSPMTDVYTAVKNFIDASGTFVCYLCGHLHDDYFGLGREADTNNQLVIGVGCASGKPSATVSGTMSRIAGQRSQDCFNVVGIDTTSKTIKIMRIGANYDRYMRKKNTLSWNYGTNQLIAKTD